VVIPNWNGRRWLPGCLDSIAAQDQPAAETILVDNGSTDGSHEYLVESHPEVRVVRLSHNTGFAHAVNRGIDAAGAPLVALVNTDVVLAPDWLARMTAAARAAPEAAAVACKMVQMDGTGRIYDAGDVLRRDGVCEQRGRFGPDDDSYDEPGEVFAACAGAALYRRACLLAVGGFDERFFAYLEDVDLGLRLRLSGWSCRYEPCVAWHAGGGSSAALDTPVATLAERNTLLLVAKAFPARWAPYVAYRQAAWAWHAARERRLRAHLQAAASAVPLLPVILRERRDLRRSAPVSVEAVVPARPLRRRRSSA